MEQYEKITKTLFRWWTYEDNFKITNENAEKLDKTATSHINKMVSEGYTSGELIDTIDSINYQGWWEIEIKIITK